MWRTGLEKTDFSFSNTFGTRIPLVLEYLCPNTFGFEYLWVVYPTCTPGIGTGEAVYLHGVWVSSYRSPVTAPVVTHISITSRVFDIYTVTTEPLAHLG